MTQTKYFDNLDINQFDKLSDNNKKQIIFEKLKSQRRLTGRKPDSDELLEKKYNRLIYFFLKRNDRIENETDKITKEKLQKMIFDCPNLLTLSLINKVKPVTNMLDLEFGLESASYILEENPVILSTSLARTGLQIRILKDTNTSEYVIEKPRNFRTSPEFMYALIKNWEINGKEGTPFISASRLNRLYKENSKTLQSKYDVRDEYGDDEYFDNR